MSDWYTDLLPLDADSDVASPSGPAVLGEQPFLFIGYGLTVQQFAEYVATYDFGPVPPDFVVLHHTYIPSATWAPVETGAVWDAGERGMSDQAIYEKRQGQLIAIRNFYRDVRSWDRGPHLFIDNKYIWLFTPMAEVGIHAAQGNAYRTGGKLHYSVGIEVIGNYERTLWPASIEHLVGQAVTILQRRLKTFDLHYVRGAGGISSHRDWGKPNCPGAAITEQYYLDVIRRATLPEATGDSYMASSLLLGQPRASLQQVSAFITSRPNGNYTRTEVVGVIVPAYWQQALAVGLDPVLVLAQMVFETDWLRSWWSQRPRRNPAGIGVTGQPGVGLHFSTWKYDAIPAHVGRLLAYALTDNQANDAQQALINKALGYRWLSSNIRGMGRVLADLDNRWSTSKGYGERIATIAELMRTYGR